MSAAELYSFFAQTGACSFASVMVLIIWNETNAFVEYSRLLLGAEFEDYRTQEDSGVLYVDYLASKYPYNFIVRLISCPMCLGVWLSIVSAFYYKNVYIIFSVFYVSLLMYFSFKLLMNKSDE